MSSFSLAVAGSEMPTPSKSFFISALIGSVIPSPVEPSPVPFCCVGQEEGAEGGAREEGNLFPAHLLEKLFTNVQVGALWCRHGSGRGWLLR